MTRTVVWFRRDLRLGDHPALTEACARGEVVPLFVLDPRLLRGRAPRREAWLQAALRALDGDLRRAGAALEVRRGDPVAEVPRLAREAGAGAVHWTRDHSPFARRRDEAVARACAGAGLTVRAFPGTLIVEPETLLTGSGRPYTVFTPYLRAWSAVPAAPPLPEPDRIPSDARTGARRAPDEGCGESAGAAAARAALERFIRQGLGNYGRDRDRLDLEGTSRLSVHLRFGTISPGQARAAVLAAARRDRRLGEGAAAFVRQLAWREFFAHVLWHHPETLTAPLRPDRRGVPWRDDPAGFEAWCQGRTGYPLVDAGMRELEATGLLPNRARLVAGSFLVKHLLIDWRRGERWFMSHLLDGDPAQNVGNWQWLASTGADALPAFRIFNPVLQGRRFDPHGAYVRRWLPELARARDIDVHAPWETGGVAGYPPPIVEHGPARARALRALGRAR